MLELSYISLLPLPVYVAIVGSLLLSIGVFLRGFFNMATPELPVLHYRESSLNSHILNKCKLKNRYFSPNFLLSSRHIQTVLPVILPKPDVTYEREYLQMRDKGVVALDWVISPHVKVKRYVYHHQMLTDWLWRSCLSTVCNLHLRVSSFGDPSDLRQVIKYIKLRMPKSQLAAVAYGTGCGLLLSYLGEFGSSALLTVGTCISPCYDVPLRFSSRVSNLYDLVLLLRLKSLLCHHAKALMDVLDIDKAISTWTFSEYDKLVYCPFYGYSDMEQFWEMNNPVRDVDDIEVPVLCVNSLDDPVSACSDIPYDLFKCYPNFLLVATSKGGHCGFLEGFPPKSWADILCLDYIESVVEFTSKNTQHQQHRPRYHSVSGSGNFGSSSSINKSASPNSNYQSNSSSQPRSRCNTLSRKRSTERFTI
ncbi:unnamed protein product [Candidula unifasciata]|uniref:Uncharacterized protein n=1 Tax=Candidula unifasciata TaxID=100452 RepID=A0A8S4A636_9EUPU|nr:unnamed protein product [Candidula unifasciata]